MKKLATTGSTLCLSVLALALSVPTTSLAQSGSAPVRVVNTSSTPVPVTLQGTGSVSGNVAITNTPNVSVINTPLPVQGTVNVGNFPTTQSVSLSAIPSGAFSVVQQVALAGNGGAVPFSGEDPGDTSYAITSLTVAADGSHAVEVWLVAVHGGCDVLPADNSRFGPGAAVPVGTTVHLSFPQPFVIPSPGSAKTCLKVVLSNPYEKGLEARVAVVGFKF